MRSAGEEIESAATSVPASSRTAAATQRTPSSASSASVAQPWRWMRSSSRSSSGRLVSAVPGMRGEAGALGVLAQFREAFLQQEELARRGDVQRGARADHVHHAHRRAARRGALDVDDLVVVAHREVHRLADLRVQFAHHRQRHLAHVDARLDQVAQFQQPHAEPVAARLDAVDQAVGGQRREDAVRGGRMQPGVLRDLLQAERLRMRGQHVEQLHHPRDDLDRVLLVASLAAGMGVALYPTM